jgi:hypothetical protein
MSLLQTLLGPQVAGLAEEAAAAGVLARLDAVFDAHVAGSADHADIGLADLLGSDGPLMPCLALAQLPPGLVLPCARDAAGQVHVGIDALARLEAEGGSGQVFYRFDLSAIRRLARDHNDDNNSPTGHDR